MASSETTVTPNIGTQCLTRHGTTTNTDPNYLNAQGQWYAKSLPGSLQNNQITFDGIAYDNDWGDYIRDTIEPCAQQSGIEPAGYSGTDLNEKFKRMVTTGGSGHFLWGTSNIHDLSPLLNWYTDAVINELSSEQAYAFYYLLNVQDTSTAKITAYPTGQLRSFDSYSSVAITAPQSQSYWKYPVPESQIWFFQEVDGVMSMIIRDYSITTIYPSSFENAAAMPVADFDYFKKIGVPADILQGWEAIYFKYGESGDTNDDFLTFTGVGTAKKNWHYNLKKGTWKENTKLYGMTSAFYWPDDGVNWFYQIYVENGVGKYNKRKNDQLVETGLLSDWPGLASQFHNGFIGVFVPGTNKLGTDLLFVFNEQYFQAFKLDKTPLYLNADGTPYEIFGYWPGLTNAEVIWQGTPKTLSSVSFSGYVRVYDGVNYITAVNGGGLGNGANVPISTYKTTIGEYELFHIQWTDPANGKFVIVTPNGKYVGAVGGGGKGAGSDTNAYPLVTNATSMGKDELLYFERQDDGRYAIRTSEGFYWSATNGGGWGEAANTYPIHTDAGRIGGWETFTLIPVTSYPA
jgi:hypothetical protein